MNQELINVLACPEKHHPLELKSETVISCPTCNRDFQVKNGIPVLLSDEELTIHEKWWELSESPLVDELFMRGIDPHEQPIRCRIRDEAKAVGNFVLDVGCATCIDYPLYREAGLFYVGVDLTYKLLLGALKHASDVPVVQGDGKKLPFKNGSFDSVYCKDMLVHLPPEVYKRVLGEMWRVTKKVLMIGFFGHKVDEAKECEYKIAEPKPDVGYNYPHYWSYYTKDAILDVLNKLSGFNGLKTEQVKFESYPDSADYRSFYIAKKSY